MKFVFTVGITEPQLCKMPGKPGADIITELFAKENTNGRFRPAESRPVVEVAKIMGAAGRDAEFSRLGITLILGAC